MGVNPVTNGSENPTKPSLYSAGFIVVEVFDTENEAAVSATITKALGATPDTKPSNVGFFSFPPRPVARSTNWRPNTQMLAGILPQSNQLFGIDVKECISYCQSVRVSLVTPHALPCILLLVHVFLDPAKLDAADARNKILKVATPFRLFVDQLNGLSAPGAGWSPRAASITWANARAEQTALDQTALDITQLENLRRSGSALAEVTKPIIDLINKRQPLNLADSAIPISSYFIPASNVHVVVAQLTQPAFGHMRTPSVVWLSPDVGLFGQLGSGVQAEDLWMAQYLGSIGYSNILLPISLEGMLTWLIALNIWAEEREIRAFGMDQQVAKMLLSPSKEATTQSIESSLSEASQVGSLVAIEERKVRSAIRWSRYTLDKIIEDAGPSHEISLTPIQPYYPQLSLFYKQINGLASITKKSLQSAAGSLRDIEAEVSKFQRHISDLATLKSRDASLKLNARLETITKVLVILTAALVVLTAVLAVKAVLGK
jgi:hypothetical protein